MPKNNLLKFKIKNRKIKINHHHQPNLKAIYYNKIIKQIIIKNPSSKMNNKIEII